MHWKTHGLAHTQAVQGIEWARVLPQLPQGLALRAALALLAVDRGSGGGLSAWLWRLLEGPAGACLTRQPSSGRASSDDAGNVRSPPFCRRMSTRRPSLPLPCNRMAVEAFAECHML